MPDGTATLDSTMVAQDFLLLLADAAPVEPENVHEARFARSGAAVGAGAGAAIAKEIVAVKTPRSVEN